MFGSHKLDLNHLENPPPDGEPPGPSGVPSPRHWQRSAAGQCRRGVTQTRNSLQVAAGPARWPHPPVRSPPAPLGGLRVRRMPRRPGLRVGPARAASQPAGHRMRPGGAGGPRRGLGLSQSPGDRHWCHLDGGPGRPTRSTHDGPWPGGPAAARRPPAKALAHLQHSSYRIIAELQRRRPPVAVTDGRHGNTVAGLRVGLVTASD